MTERSDWTSDMDRAKSKPIAINSLIQIIAAEAFNFGDAVGNGERYDDSALKEAKEELAAQIETIQTRAESAEALVREVAELDSFTKSMYDRSSNFLGLGCWECGAIKNSEHEEYCVLGKCKRHAEEQS